MKFKISQLGNRICIKTLKPGYTKVTYMRTQDAKKTLMNIHKYGWEVQQGGNITNKEIKQLIQT